MSSEQDLLYQRKYAVSSDGDHSLHGDISAGGMSNKNTEWMQNSYTWVSELSCLLVSSALFGCAR